jgi:kumamolisin
MASCGDRGSPPIDAQPNTSGTLIGPAPADAQLVVAFGLARDEDGLSAFARQVSDPGDPAYGKFLEIREVGNRFGASQQDIDSVVSGLAGFGVVGRPDVTRAMVVAEMTAAQASDVFDVGFDLRQQSNGAVYITPAKTARLPDSLRAATQFPGLVEEYQPPPSLPTGGSATCADALATAESRQPRAILDRYGISQLQAMGLQGQGMRMAVIAIESFSQPGLDAYTACYGLPPLQAEVVKVTPHPILDTGTEVSLDTAIVVSVAPQLSELYVIEIGEIADPLLGLDAALDPANTGGTQVDVVSSSIGFCEHDLDKDRVSLSEHVLMSAAAAGISVVASSGDDGSSGCHPSDDAMAAQYPASSPNVVAVGGTATQSANAQAGQVEMVWNAGGQAGGGVDTSMFPIPPYQHDAGISGKYRHVPDVAFGANPSNSPPFPVCTTADGCSWLQVGGTSAAAPLFGSALLLVGQGLRAEGKPPLGFLDPLLYQLAQGPQGAGVVMDVTVGDNDLFETGCCQAAPGYDPASGWGSLNMAGLYEYAQRRVPV